MASKNKPARLKRCQWMLEDGSQCPNYFQGQGKHCYGHATGGGGGGGNPEGPKPPDKGPGNGPAWVTAITGLIGVVAANVVVAWPHVEPWVRTHVHFFSQLGQLLDDAIATGEDGPDEASHLDFTARYETLSVGYSALQEAVSEVVLEPAQEPRYAQECEVLGRPIEGPGGVHVIGEYDMKTGQFRRYPMPKKVRVESTE